MPTTTRGYSYPASTDQPRVWEDIQELAEDVDADVTASINMPVGRIVASGTQSIPHNTATAVTFTGTDDIDTHGQHNPASNPTRVTPNVAGIYEFTGTLVMGGRTDWVWFEAAIRKNGGVALAPYVRCSPMVGASYNQVRMAQTTVKVAMNGTTDYIEMLATQVNGAAAASSTNQSSQYSSVLEWSRLRD